MKRFSLFTLLFSILLGYILPTSLAWAESAKSPLAYLNAMTNAHRTLNYEQLYLLQQGELVTSLRYRHAYAQGKEYAQLLRLDHLREEIILRDDTVSYFGEFQPFSLPSPRILDDLPSVIYADFNQLTDYHFIDAGRMRIADRLARVLRILPKDESRYQYELWIDEETFLLLRSDLLDRDRQVLEQFRVIQSIVDEQLLSIVEPVRSLMLPPLIQDSEKGRHPLLTWQPVWIPAGFKEVTSGKQSLSQIELEETEQVESRLYSDGLFSFSIYWVQNKGVIFNEQFLRQGKMSLYSQTVGDKDVVVIGDIPLMSARHIVQDLQKTEKNLPVVIEGKSQ